MIGQYGTTVTIIRQTPGGYDQYGEPIPGEQVTIPVPGCSVQNPITSLSVEAGAVTPLTQLVVYMPPGTELVTSPSTTPDKILVNGTQWNIDGRPTQLVSSATGRKGWLQVPLKTTG
ncbi:MAG: hypothetical protein E7Z97_07185 [Propionibacteriaceae bacterium]|nr:hypothetical protein [Propionibacteriaceae bacterium]